MKKRSQNTPPPPLEDLLRDTEDEQEKTRLKKAWRALDSIAAPSSPLQPSEGLLMRIKYDKASSLDQPLSDDELEGVAAAGTQVSGTAGDDTLYCGGDDDDIDGGAGNDYLDGGAGDDTLTGGAGDDTLTGGEGGDTFIFKYGDGNVTITDFEKGKDTLVCEMTDRASLKHTDGDTIITYRDGSTLTLVGVELSSSDLNMDVRFGDGDDGMSASGGDDTLDGGAGDDKINGKAGDDVLIGGQGDDTLTGGSGNDTFVFDADSGNDTVTDFHSGEDRIVLQGVAGGEYSIEYDAETGHSTITYAGGTITVQGVQISSGDIDLAAEGGEGMDFLNGGAGDDTLSGGEGDDFLSGGDGEDQLSGGEGDDALSGAGGDDVLDGGAGNDRLGGGTGDDTLSGGTGDDTLSGGEGDDALSGGAGQDSLDGGSGNDTLYGGFGMDGTDVLTGGAGADTFVFGAAHGSDTVTDFNPQEDSLQFLGVDSMDNIQVQVVDGNTVITYGATTITLQGVEMSLEEVWARVKS